MHKLTDLSVDVTDQIVDFLRKDTQTEQITRHKYSIYRRYIIGFRTTTFVETIPGDVGAVKALRLMSKDFANRYGLFYIRDNIGADIGRSKHYAVMYLNSNLSRKYLIDIAATSQIPKLMARIRRITLSFYVANVYNDNSQDLLNTFIEITENPSLIYDNEYMAELVRSYRLRCNRRQLHEFSRQILRNYSYFDTPGVRIEQNGMISSLYNEDFDGDAPNMVISDQPNTVTNIHIRDDFIRQNNQTPPRKFQCGIKHNISNRRNNHFGRKRR